jgi:hypothetical protein
MMLHGKQIRENLDGAKKMRFTRTIYAGPYRHVEWNKSMTLILCGEPGVGKTQWACWFAAHHGGYFYCKGSLESMRHYRGERWVIYDDIKVDDKREYDDVFDVENGGMFMSRYKDIQIPAGPKIWLQNPGVQIPDKFQRIYGRRAFVYNY